MQIEFICLALLALFLVLAFIPASYGKGKTYGIKWAASNRDRIPAKDLPLWVSRCERAHINLKDNFPSFAVTIFILAFMGKFSSTTAFCAQLYLGARLVHFLSYGIGNSPLRTLGYMTGLTINIYLIFLVLT